MIKKYESNTLEKIGFIIFIVFVILISIYIFIPKHQTSFFKSLGEFTNEIITNTPKPFEIKTKIIYRNNETGEISYCFLEGTINNCNKLNLSMKN